MKNKRANAMAIAMGVIAVIIGVAMIPVFTSLIDDEQSIVAAYTENITTTTANQTVTLVHDDITGTVTVVNMSGDNTNGAVTLRDGYEYSLTEYTGEITFHNWTSSFNVTYGYKPDGYVDSATGRTVVRQITLMYGVALILLTLAAVGLYLFKK